MSKLRPNRVSVHVSSSISYPVVIGTGLEKELLAAVAKERDGRIAVITDSIVKRLWGTQMTRLLKRSGRNVDLISFPAGERNKNQSTVTHLQHELLKRGFGRDTLIIAFGGGVVGDLAGFVAATYLRGVPYIHVPTTLLAMVDSSIGGKVGIDTPYGKNTIGAFWHPKAIISDLRFLKGLPKTQLISGLLEAVKSFFTSDKSSLSLARKLDLNDPLKNANVIQGIVYASVAHKAGVIARDERESNGRKVLNFGHTIGHAIELLSGFKIPHGYAVGYGILAETKISELLGHLSAKDRAAVHDYLAALGIRGNAISRFSIPAILRTTRSDKKTRGGVPHYVLLSSIGSVYKRDGKFAQPVKDSVVRRALRSL